MVRPLGPLGLSGGLAFGEFSAVSDRRRFRSGSHVKRFQSFGALAILVSLVACSAPHSSVTGGAALIPASGGRHIQDTLGGSPPMSMDAQMYDAPLLHDGAVHVNIALLGAWAVSAGIERPLVTYPGANTVDLTALQQTPLSLRGNVQAGHYDAIRLVVDPTRSNVVLGGRTYPMIFAENRPHSDRSAVVEIDANVALDGAPGELVHVAVDFNVLESVAIRGGYAYVRPKLVAADRPADLAGTVRNKDGRAVTEATVVALENGAVVNTTLTGSDGTFRLHALHAGHYTIEVRNKYVTESGERVVATGATSAVGPSTTLFLAASEVIDIGTLTD